MKLNQRVLWQILFYEKTIGGVLGDIFRSFAKMIMTKEELETFTWGTLKIQRCITGKIDNFL